MAGNDFQFFNVLLQDFRRSVGDITMRYAVETVAADMIFFVITIGDRVRVSKSLHGLVERRVKDGHLRDAGHQLGTNIDPHQVRRVMERGKFLG